MQTIKTAVVVVLLLFVLYGGYIALNGTDSPLKPELEEKLLQLDNMPDVSGPGPLVASKGNSPSNGFESFNSIPSSNFAPSNSPSPFGSSNAFPSTNGTVPDLSMPPSTPAPTPSLIPSLPNSNPSPTNSASPFPSSDNGIPPLPPLGGSAENDVPELSADDSNTISTSTPGFGLNAPSPKIPGDLVSTNSSSTFPPLPSAGTKPLPPPDGGLGSGDTSSESLSTSGSPLGSNAASKSYQNAKELAMDQIERGNLKEALATLSVFYNAAELTSDQRQDMLDLLDALAREVVYSRRHLLEIAHVVAPGDTLEQVAKQCQVPADILAKINALDASAPLPNGAKLKIVPGPFRAEVDLAKSELTVFLGDLYAGRYPVSFGNEPSPQAGVYQVVDKRRDRNYYGNGIQMIPANDPRNPYGGWWIDLGQDLCIHGSAETEVGNGKLGCISLPPQDASDLYGMLSQGSQVTIRK